MTDHDPAVQPEEGGGNPPVLVAVDFSEDSEAAANWACQYCKMSQSPLVVLHVIHDQPESPGLYKQENTRLKPMEDVAKSMMNEFMDRIRSLLGDHESLTSADLQLVSGLPPSRIVEVAELFDARLIVLGSRGITGLPHMLLGSVAERVVELSNRPVVVVKSRDIQKPGKKEAKRLRKQKKKDWKKLKEKLGLDSSAEENSDG
jgi:nucleotide-binding universal stress UspA family protein